MQRAKIQVNVRSLQPAINWRCNYQMPLQASKYQAVSYIYDTIGTFAVVLRGAPKKIGQRHVHMTPRCSNFSSSAICDATQQFQCQFYFLCVWQKLYRILGEFHKGEICLGNWRFYAENQYYCNSANTKLLLSKEQSMSED